MGDHTLVLGSSRDQLTVTSSQQEKGSTPRTSGGPALRDGPLCVTAGLRLHPVSVLYLFLVSLLKHGTGVCVLRQWRCSEANPLRLERCRTILSSSPQSHCPQPPAWVSEAETPTMWLLMAQRGHLGNVVWYTKNFCVTFLVFYPLVGMLYIHMVQNSKYKRAHIVETLFPTQSEAS